MDPEERGAVSIRVSEWAEALHREQRKQNRFVRLDAGLLPADPYPADRDRVLGDISRCFQLSLDAQHAEEDIAQSDNRLGRAHFDPHSPHACLDAEMAGKKQTKRMKNDAYCF